MIATPVSQEMLLHVVKVLPTAPQILALLGRLLLDMSSGLADVTDLLRRDAGLTARIIRVANSSVYNKGAPAASLVDALARVGFKEVYRMTGFAAVSQLSDQKLPLYGLSGAQLRENALLTALMMEALASPAGVDARQAYTAGLLRSTGRIALDRIFRDDASTPEFPHQIASVSEWEMRFAGIHNCTAAAIILGEWHFPAEMIDAIRDHYLLEGGTPPLTHLLNVAAGEAERAGHGLPGESAYWDLAPEKLAAARINEAELRAASANARASFETLRAVVA